ncbi:hypothetical protein HDU80_004007 [Chytriomyces hyalinus]|nr:hypothetical protein HDU80_004007 [Chytriomyces hyalinus]
MSPGIGSQVLRWGDPSKRSGKRNVSSAPVMSGRRSDTADTPPGPVADNTSPVLMGSVLALVHSSTQSAFRALLVRVDSVHDIDRAALAILSAAENSGQNTVPAPPSQSSSRPTNSTLFRSGSLYSKRKTDLRDQNRPRSSLTFAAAKRIEAAALGHLSFAAIAGHAVVVFVPILDARQRDADESLEESALQDPWYLHLDQVSRIFDETEINSPSTRDEYKFQCTSSSTYSRWIDVLDECFDECHPYESLNQHYLMQGKRASYISSSHATYNNIPSSPTIYLTDRSKSGESSGSGGGGAVWSSRSDNAKKVSSLTDDVNGYWSSGGRGTSDASNGTRRGRDQEAFSLRRASTKSPLSSTTFSQMDSILETDRVKSIGSSERGGSSSSHTHGDMDKSVFDSVETLQSTSLKSEKSEDTSLFVEYEHSPASSKSPVKTKQSSETTPDTSGSSGLTRMASFMQPNISIVQTNDKLPSVDDAPSVDDKPPYLKFPQISKPLPDSSALTIPTKQPEPTPRAAEVVNPAPRVRRVEKRLSNSSLVSTLATSGEVKSMFSNAVGISIGSLSPVIELAGKPQDAREHVSSTVRVESKTVVTERAEVTLPQNQETRKDECIASKDEAGQIPIPVSVSKSVQFTLPEQWGVENATQPHTVKSDQVNVAALNDLQKQHVSSPADHAQPQELQMSPTSSERAIESPSHIVKSPNRLVSASLRNSRRSSFVSSLRETTERILRETGVGVSGDSRSFDTVKADTSSTSPKTILLNQLKIAMDSAAAGSLVSQQGDGKSIVYKNVAGDSVEKSHAITRDLNTTVPLGAIADQHKPDSEKLVKESEKAVMDKHEEKRIEEQAFITAFETSSRSVTASSPETVVPAVVSFSMSEIRAPGIRNDDRFISNGVGYTPWNSPISPKYDAFEQDYLGDLPNVPAYSFSKPPSPIPSDSLCDSSGETVTSTPPPEIASSETLVRHEQSAHANDTDFSNTLQSQGNHSAMAAVPVANLDEVSSPQKAVGIVVERTTSMPWIPDTFKVLDSPIQDLLDELAKEEWTDVYDDVLMLPEVATQDTVAESVSFLTLNDEPLAVQVPRKIEQIPIKDLAKQNLQVSSESFVTLKDELMAAERISAYEPDSPMEPVIITKYVFNRTALKTNLFVFKKIFIENRMLRHPGLTGAIIVGDQLCWQPSSTLQGVVLGPCNVTDAGQQWALLPRSLSRRDPSPPAYQISNLGRDLCVHVSNITASWIRLLPCNEADNAQLFDALDGSVLSRTTGTCLESFGNNTLARDCEPKKQTSLRSRDGSDTAATGSIVAMNGMCWTRTSNFSVICLPCKDTSSAQQFSFVATGTNVVIQSEDKRTCLEIDSSEVLMKPCYNTSMPFKKQRFSVFQEKGVGKVTLASADSGLCLDVETSSTLAPGQLKQWLCNNHVTQIFTLPKGFPTHEKISSLTSTSHLSPISHVPSATSKASVNTIAQPLTTPAPTTIAVPSEYTLIQAAGSNGVNCWEVDAKFALVAASCEHSNPSQWWKSSFGQLIHTNASGNPTCVQASKSEAGGQLIMANCSASIGQVFLFDPVTNRIRVAATMNCVAVGVNKTLVVELCVNGAAADSRSQTFTFTNNSVIFPPPSSNGACDSFKYRKEWRDLTQAERKAYIAAVEGIRRLPSAVGHRSYFDDLVAVHATLLDYFHGNPSFWPWHRKLTLMYEEALQKVDASVTLPYWDWGFDGDYPLDNTDIFGSGPLQFGTRGDPKAPYPSCLHDGFAKSWTSMFGQCTSRNYSLDVVIYDDSHMMPLILSSKTFDAFSKAAEYAHNVAHFFIGGTQGDMYYLEFSINDPLFFLIHGNVDRYWDLWQKHHPKQSNTYVGTQSLPPNSKNRVTVQLSDIMPGFNVPVSSTMSADGGNGYCVKYTPYSKSKEAIAASLVEGREKIKVTPSSRSWSLRKFEKRQSYKSPPSLPENWNMTNTMRLDGVIDHTARANMMQRMKEGKLELLRLAADFKAMVSKVTDARDASEARLSVIRSLVAVVER